MPEDQHEGWSGELEADELQGWPSTGDRPFQPATPAHRPVDVAGARYVGFASHLYLLGYRRAAELLLPELTSRSNPQLVFPFLFLWRQHIELSLKYVIELARRVHGETGNVHGHRLPDLWRECRRLLEIDETADEVLSTYDAIDLIVADLEVADPNSVQSRYAEGETPDFLVKSLAKVPDGFDAAHFEAVLTKVSFFFDCVQTDYKHRLEIT